MKWLNELIIFTWRQALCCVFPVIIFGTLALSKVMPIPLMHRYDFMLIVCIAAQVVLIRTKIESMDELKVITLFHVIGLGLELFKVQMGSWAYPEAAWTKLGGVPLYSGFMYASVASYICQAWRRFDLRLVNWPPRAVTIVLAAAIYANFFTHHMVADLRWYITASLLVIFPKTYIRFKVKERIRRMPVVVSFILIAFFIWLAENIGTFLGGWTYPGQKQMWRVVHIGIMSSWFLLVIISIIIVVELKHIKSRRNPDIRQ